MPSVTANGIEIEYDDRGQGPPIVFGHGLLASKEMFAAQVAALEDRYRCVSLNWRGHGATSFPRAEWTLWDMVDDTVALCGELGIERAVFAGLSQGGMAFMRLAMAHPELVEGLVLMDTSAGAEDPDMLDQYIGLAEAFREEPSPGVADAAAMVLYSQAWMEQNPEAYAHERDVMLSHQPEGIYWAATGAVFKRESVVDRLGEIAAPTLVVVGAEDVATPPEKAQQIADGVPGAELVTIPDAGHHTPIENPAPVTAALEAFLARVAPATAPARPEPAA